MKEVIRQIRGREILNARGKPTVEAELVTGSSITVTASVPSGSSTGRYEAFELYDGGSRYGGYGTRRAAANISGELNDCLRGMAVEDLRRIDERICRLDGTPDKSRLGGNALLTAIRRRPPPPLRPLPPPRGATPMSWPPIPSPATSRTPAWITSSPAFRTPAGEIFTEQRNGRMTSAR